MGHFISYVQRIHKIKSTCHNSGRCVSFEGPGLVNLARLRVDEVNVAIIAAADQIYSAALSQPRNHSIRNLYTYIISILPTIVIVLAYSRQVYLKLHWAKPGQVEAHRIVGEVASHPQLALLD